MKLACFAAIALLIAAPASATTFTVDLETEFSGGADPAGGAPWITLTFDDSVGGANTVQLTISNVGITAAEFVSGIYVNFDSALDPDLLTITAVDVTASTPAVSTGVDAFKADGDGFFDILFNFPPPPGQQAAKFTAGESVVFDLSYITPINANSFDFESAMGGGNGSFTAAAHVQGIAGGLSGWIGNVPEPGSFALLVAALGLAARLQRRQR